MGSKSSKVKSTTLANGAAQTDKGKTRGGDAVRPLSVTESCWPDGCSKEQGERVILNVYNLQQGVMSPKERSVNERLGLGLYHSGIEIFGTEWSFAGSEERPPGFCGIFPSRPKSLPLGVKDSIVLGHLPVDTPASRVYAILENLRPSWDACSYNLVQRNCNHFTQAFRDAIAAEFPDINLGPIPSYVNRAARMADAVIPGMLYRHMLSRASSTKSMSELASPAARDHLRAEECVGRPGEGDVKTIPIPSSREKMRGMSVREMKTMMWVNGISWDGCVEKEDLIQAVEAHRQGQQQQQH